MIKRRQIDRAIAIAISIIAIVCLLSNPINNSHRSFFVDGFVVKHPSASRTAIATTSTSTSTTKTLLPVTALGAAASTVDNNAGPPTPVLNGKRILPIKIMLAGLRGHTVAAAYCVMSRDYKKTSPSDSEWRACQHVGTTTDLCATLQRHLDDHGRERVAHVRALSFQIPSESAMESIASDWRKLVLESEGGMTNFDPILAAMDVDDFLDDDDDDDGDFDDDDDDDYFEMMAGAMAARQQPMTTEAAASTVVAEASPAPNDPAAPVVSPFDNPEAYATTTEDGEALEFNKENVDKVLDEIRPYLISDGGNVSVDSIDEKTKSVYLVLEGACGSCPSSTITMQMGIERVLKENFVGLGEVKQVDPGASDDEPKELTYVTVEKEVNRIKPAIIAMGGSVTILEVDPIGTVKLRFRGANKVRQGLEMALLDIDFVKHVDFVME